MKIFWALAVFAFAVLGVAAVWLGGLNQDEGWYLYAANMVAEGKTLYKDFFFTQGPVMPTIYDGFTWVWQKWGLLGARIFTLTLGFAGICFATGLARSLAPEGRKGEASLIAFMLLGCNLYHLYYVAIPKTYALASVFVLMGFIILMLLGNRHVAIRYFGAALSGHIFAVAAGTRISLAALLVVVGLWLLIGFRRYRFAFLWFGLGGLIGLCLVYGVYLIHPSTRAGLIAAQQYHAARGGFDMVWAVGSVSRLVRWYLPVFVVLGLGVAHALEARAVRTENQTIRQSNNQTILLWGFLAVFVVQMLAPFPYEDYQVPIMGLLAVYASVAFVRNDGFLTSGKDSAFPLTVLLVLGLCFANSFGSPLLEKWMTNGQDRFWSLKKEKCELSQLRDVAKRIERIDPDGKTIFTQDLYLAIETNRKVPKGLEMGPFAMLTDEEWKTLLSETAPRECAVAALSGYSFAILPPKCDERPVAQQLDFWTCLKRSFELVGREEAFGQNATPLLILKRK